MINGGIIHIDNNNPQFFTVMYSYFCYFTDPNLASNYDKIIYQTRNF